MREGEVPRRGGSRRRPPPSLLRLEVAAAEEEEGRPPWWCVAGARCELRFGYEGTREVDVAVDRDRLIPPESGWGWGRWEVGGREFGAGGDEGACMWGGFGAGEEDDGACM